MDQGPIHRPPRPPWRLSDTLELAGAAARQLAIGAGLAIVAAAGWSAVSANHLRDVLPLTLLVVAALMPMFMIVSSRADMAMHLDRLGQRPQAPGDGDDIDGLTSIGTLLFVSVPLAIAATWLGI